MAKAGGKTTMQLLLRRRTITGGMVPRFSLWAKFDVTQEELRLIQHYRVTFGYLTIEASRRDFYRDVGFGLLATLVLFSIFAVIGQSMPPQTRAAQPEIPLPVIVAGFLFIWGLAAWFIYEQLRLAIKIVDMLNGREFKHKSLVLMVQRERVMIGYGYAFMQLLEKLQTWEGTEVIEIGEEHEGALRLVTDVRAAA